jgi:hypothetical protein
VVLLLGASAAPATSAREESTPESPAGKAPRGAAVPDPRALEGRLRAADELLRTARFEEAVAETDAIRDELAVLGPHIDARRVQVRNEVMAATARMALDEEDAARECFRRALAAEPALDLDPAATPPKVLRVFLAVRAEPRDAR